MKSSDIKYLIVHCSDSNWGDLNEVRRWHTDPAPRGRGWADIGYHYLIQNPYPTYRAWSTKTSVTKSDGLIVPGRPVTQSGAHALGYNAKSLGICLVGKGNMAPAGYDFTPAQLLALEDLLLDLMEEYGVPVENVLGHKETEQSGGKTCPNLDMKELRQALKARTQS